MRRLIAAGIVAVLALAGSAAAAIELEDSKAPALLSADRLSYDRERGVVAASGHVEIVQGERILLADRVTYDEREGRVIALGNVSLLEPGGDVIFADYMELTDELKTGVIRNIRLLLSDGSRLAANGARRTDGNRTEMSKAIFSPCEICSEDPERLPLWQIKAIKVIHDQEDQVIEYKDAFLEFFGVPIAYTPYFQHPDPTVQRKSGFLTPSYGSSSLLGLTLEVPYFWNIQPHRDITFAPIFTSKEGVVLAGEYRQHTGNGAFQLGGSITRPDQRDDKGELLGGSDTRGHIEGEGLFELSPVWHWGFDLLRSTDDTYLQRYGFTSVDTLTSNLFVEGIDQGHFFAAEAYSFQGLGEGDDPDETPLILPLVDYEVIRGAGPAGSLWGVDANALVLFRKDGAKSRRLSTTGSWSYSRVGSWGDIYGISVGLRGDLYWVEDVADPNSPQRDAFSGLTGRVVPEAIFEWRYPFVSQQGSLRQVIEPVAIAIISPYGGNSEKIPNEDSQDFEFNDTNLFSPNRFTGFDRIEGGPRANYGLRWGLYGPAKRRITALIGQSYRLKNDETFRTGSGLDSHFSDFVGRITATPSDFLDLSYRFRFDRDDFSANRNEINARIGPSFLRLSIDYTLLNAEESRTDQPAFASREEINLGATLQMTEYWRLLAYDRRDLTGDGGTLNAGGSIVYEDECFLFTFQANRRFTRDRDVEPETTLLFRIQFKYLG